MDEIKTFRIILLLLKRRWFGLLYLYCALVGWQVLTDFKINFSVLLVIFLIVITSFIIGDLFFKFILKEKKEYDSLSFRIVSGLLVNASLLYFFTILFKFELIYNFLLISCIAFILWFRNNNLKSIKKSLEKLSFENYYILLGLISASIWCSDLLVIIDPSKTSVIIPAWPDVFYHLAQINSFSFSSGLATIYDIHMSGVTAHLYHHASYIFPALLVTVGGVSDWASYAGFLVPVGITLTFMAAYSLAAPIFGNVSAMAAGLGLLLIPDATQQGFGNPFMGYHWMQQIGPAGSYGVAAAAISFSLVIEACRYKNPKLIIYSYLFLLITLIFKAQIFVAAAFLILIIPALFYPALHFWKRLFISILIILLFIFVIKISQRFQAVPLLRLDWSSFSDFYKLVTNLQIDGLVKNIFLNPTFFGDNLNINFIIFLCLITFGVLPIVYFLVIIRFHKKFEVIVWVFPILVVVNYLFMATGLAMDNRKIGSPEELLHRPFVWAYFVVLVWTISSLSSLLLDSKLFRERNNKALFSITIIIMLLIPLSFSRNIQTLPMFGVEYPSVPRCLYQLTNFIKNNSDHNDIVQSVNYDPKFLLTALSSRKPYVANDIGNIRSPKGMDIRLKEIADILLLESLEDVYYSSKNLNIKWWVIEPNVKLNWDNSVFKLTVFSCDQYTVLDLR